MRRTTGMSAGLQPAAQRVRQHLFGDHGHEGVGPAQNGLPQRHRTVDLRSVRERARHVERRAIGARIAPLLPPNQSSPAQTPRGSITRWQPAQGWFLRCNSSCARTVFGTVDAPLLLSSSEGTFGGGGGGGVFRKVLSTYFPR